MSVKIDRKLNIVFEIDDGAGGSIHVHAMPIGRPVFERFYVPISMTFEAMWSRNLTNISGPRIANLILKEVSTKLGIWEDVQAGLINEIERLTNVITFANGRWNSLPYYEARKDGLLSEEDGYEIAGILTFFTCISVMHTRSQLPAFLQPMQLWGVGTTSLTLMEYQTSLPISTPDENSGEKKPAALSVPS